MWTLGGLAATRSDRGAAARFGQLAFGDGDRLVLFYVFDNAGAASLDVADPTNGAVLRSIPLHTSNYAASAGSATIAFFSATGNIDVAGARSGAIRTLPVKRRPEPPGVQLGLERRRQDGWSRPRSNRQRQTRRVTSRASRLGTRQRANSWGPVRATSAEVSTEISGCPPGAYRAERGGGPGRRHGDHVPIRRYQGRRRALRHHDRHHGRWRRPSCRRPRQRRSPPSAPMDRSSWRGAFSPVRSGSSTAGPADRSAPR